MYSLNSNIMKKMSFILIAFMLLLPLIEAQNTTIHHYRKVAPDNMKEFLHRAETYWKVFAEKEIEKGNLLFFAVLVKVGGNEDIQHSPNVLIITSVKDIDNEIKWMEVKELFPDVPMEDIQVHSLSTRVSSIYLRDLDNHIQGSSVNPDTDFKYAKFNYFNSTDTWKHITFEAEVWKPMLKKAMDDGKATMKGWGHSLILAPETPTFQYGSVSYDLFSSIKDAYGDLFTDDVEMPEGIWDDYIANNPKPKATYLFKIITVVSAN